MRRHLRISLPAFILSSLLLAAGVLPAAGARADDSMSPPADQQGAVDPAQPVDKQDPADPAQPVDGDKQDPAQPGDGQDPADPAQPVDKNDQDPADPAAPGDEQAATDSQTVSADALPTAQIGNGVVWDQAVVGNTVYVAGSFSTARPAGSAAGENERSRANLMAYDITTGELLGWAPTTNAPVYSITPSADGSTLYLGGAFTQLDGVNTYRVGAVSAADGSRQQLGVATNAAVRAVEVSSDGKTLYFGGGFSQVNSSSRYRAAAFDLGSRTLKDFAPGVADRSVLAIAAAPDGNGVAIGGSFTSVNGSTSPGYGMAILENDGTVRANSLTSVVRNAGTYGAIMSLRADSQGLYGSGYSQSRREGNIEGLFRADWNSGELAYLADCHGDTYDVQPMGDVVYASSHTHDCSNISGFPDARSYHHAVAFTNKATGTVLPNTAWGYADHAGQPAPTNLNFYPEFTVGTFTGLNQATWTVEGNKDYIVYGGEFTAVNGTAQQGLVRFARRGIAPNKMGPENKGGAYPVTVSSTESGVVSLSFQANWDRDDTTLTYKVYRDNANSKPVSTQKVTASFWDLPQLTATDTVKPGTEHRYRVAVEDPWGASTVSDWVSVTAAGQPGDEPAPDPGGGDVGVGEAFLEDSFDRTTDSGWGTADKGGDWTADWGRGNFSTADSKGLVAMKGARSSSAIHSAVVNSTSTEAQVDMSLDGLAAGNGAYITYVGRQTDAGRYQAEFRVAADGTVTMTVGKKVGDTSTVIGTAAVGKYTAGQPLHLRLDLDGAESTAVRARAWIGDSEPAEWQVDKTDDDAALAAPGSVGVSTYVSASAGSGQINLGVDSLKVTRLH